MQVTTAKVILRIVGTVIGSFGIIMSIFWGLFVFQGLTQLEPWMLPLLLFPLLISVYFVYFAYLTWWQFSPATIRRACSVVLLSLFLLIVRLFDPRHDLGRPWLGFIGVAGLLFLLWGNRAANRYFNRHLFPEQ